MSEQEKQTPFAYIEKRDLETLKKYGCLEVLLDTEPGSHAESIPIYANPSAAQVNAQLAKALELLLARYVEVAENPESDGEVQLARAVLSLSKTKQVGVDE